MYIPTKFIKTLYASPNIQETVVLYFLTRGSESDNDVLYTM